jgi:hypothetical protein
LVILLGLSQQNVAQGQEIEAGSGNESDAEIDLLVEFPDGEPIRLNDENNERGQAYYILEQYVGKIYLFGAGFVSVIAVIWVVIGGYEIMVSGVGNAGDISSGKDKITRALLGLVLVFMSALILHTINPAVFSLG